MEKVKINKIIKTEYLENENALEVNSLQNVHPFMRSMCVLHCGGYIIVDFGAELCGRVHIVFGGCEGGKFRLRLGESVAEICAEQGEKNAGNYHSLRDCRYPVVGWSDFSSSETGFRFARIDIIEGENIAVSEIYAEAALNGLEEKGTFACSDKKLNDIYRIAKRTLSLCVRENAIWDGIKRDRVVWIGDFYPELIGSFAIYGNIFQFKTVLDTVKDYNDGWINYIPSYSAWWIICLEKYYELTADIGYVNEMLPYVDKIIGDFSAIVKNNGDISYDGSCLTMFESNEFFFDWPTNFTQDSETGWRYLLIYAMQRAINLYALCDKKSAAAEEIIVKLNKYEYKPSKFKQVTALGVLANKIEKRQAKELLEQDGTKGMTAFMSFAIIEALHKIGEDEYALRFIKDYYGAMIDMGATTFWEDFDTEWLKDNPLSLDSLPDDKRKNIHADYGKFCYTGLRHSLCHGWSSGFIEFFYRHVLGIIPIKAGYKKIKVQPNLCGLDFVEGELPTIYGNIKVKHSVINGKVKTEISVPAGVEIINQQDFN